MQKRSIRMEEATAYHEAGHFVAAVHVGLTTKRVTIIPEENDSHGHILIKPPFRRSDNPEFERSDRLLLKFDRYAIYCLAGMEAQRKFRASSIRSYHGHSDYMRVLDWLEYFAESDDEAQVWIRLLLIRARNLVTRGWLNVEAIAAALMEHKTLSAAEGREVMRKDLFQRRVLRIGPDRAAASVKYDDQECLRNARIHWHSH